MKRSDTRICLVAVISLLLSVIWHCSASAAVAPIIEALGEIRQPYVLVTPGRVDVDASGNLYVTDARLMAVVKFDKYGNLVRSFTGVPVSGSGLAVTPDGSRIYVAGRNVVTILDGITGEAVGSLGSGAGEFSHAGEIDLDASGRIFVADSASKYVKVYGAEDSAFQYQFGGNGTGAGQFKTIWTLSVDEQAGEVYAADVQNSRIQVFDLAGVLRRTLTAASGFGSPAMTYFGGIAFDRSGRGYFLESFRSQVRILGLPTSYLSTYAEVGYGIGQLSGPLDAVFDPATGRLFVSCDGARIEIFGIDGGQNPVNANEKPGLPSLLSPVGDSEVASSNPALFYQNATDPDGDLLVYDVRVFRGEEVVGEYVGLPEGEGTSYAQVDIALEENARYQWSAQAFDGEDASGWTGLESFYVNAVQEPPSTPIPVVPQDDEILDGEGNLSWQASADPDPFDTVGYVLEIANDPSFASPLLEEAVEGTTVALKELSSYGALDDGGAYFWRVKAVDNHGVSSAPSEAGRFLYDTTLLVVTANMPGAKVYVGGNHAYAGRFIGQTPLELRDFPAGPSSVIVERAGLEPFVAQIRPGFRENVGIYAEMVPAIAPTDLKASPFEAGGEKLVLSGDAAPFAVDFDNDGLIDLLTADSSGAMTLFKGAITAEGKFYYSAGVSLDLPLIPGAIPFVADWDNDGRKDILVGGDDGTVRLFRNTGTEEAPAFAGGTYLQAGGAPIAVGAAAAPAVIDLDGDGHKDLVVGSASGAVVWLRNTAEDAAPQLAYAGTLISLSSPVAPFFVDWDANGDKELLLAASEHVYRYVRRSDGSFSPVEVLSVGSDLLGKNGNSVSGAFSMGDRLRIFALDADGKKGKDLIIGNAGGEVRLVNSNGSEPVPAFTGALLDKVSQIAQMVRESAPELVSLINDIEAAIEVGDFKGCRHLLRSLTTSVDGGTELAAMSEELEGLLQF